MLSLKIRLALTDIWISIKGFIFYKNPIIWNVLLSDWADQLKKNALAGSACDQEHFLKIRNHRKFIFAQNKKDIQQNRLLNLSSAQKKILTIYKPQ